MQTFLPHMNLVKAISMLDNKRLGKQRVEAIQIASCLLEKETRWKNHPAVLMWKGYEEYLVVWYLYTAIRTYEMRGFKNEKCYEHFYRLSEKVKPQKLLGNIIFGMVCFLAYAWLFGWVGYRLGYDKALEKPKRKPRKRKPVKG